MMLVTSVFADPRAHSPQFGSPYTAHMGVEVHKKCVIWVTIVGLDQRTDTSDKRRIDLGSQLAERL